LVEEHGAAEIAAYATHGVLSGPAIERISESKLKEVVLTDTITHDLPKGCKNIRFLSAAPLLSEAMHRIITGESLSALFTSPPAEALR
jgi:ribose-phosphate pyrophosphokinase